MNMRIFGGVLFATALTFFARTGEAANVSVVSRFDPNQGQLPESITRDFSGNIILSMAGAHTISKIIPDGMHSAVPIATLPVAAGAFSVGVKVSEKRDIFACSAAFNPALDASHVWRISPTGDVTEFAHLNANGFPNDLAFDEDDNLFVTDSQLGLLYKIDAHGHFAVWLSDPRLLGNPQHPLLGSPFGANGIAFDRTQRHLYISNTDFGVIYRTRINDDGSPGPLEVFASDPRLAGADGIAFNERGQLYVAVDAQNQIVQIDRCGALTVVAEGAPLDSPSSFAFASEGEDATTLFISSFAISEATGVRPGTPQPSLDSIHVAIGGLPLL
jgi:sugar lactone lactonase YvrE